NTGDVFKGHLILVFSKKPRTTLTKTHGLTAAGLNLAEEEHKEKNNKDQRQPVKEHLSNKRIVVFLVIGNDTVFFNELVPFVAGVAVNLKARGIAVLFAAFKLVFNFTDYF